MEKTRKRLYRLKVKCSKCNKQVDSDYKSEHVKRTHKGEVNIQFFPVVDPKQPKLQFHAVSGKNNNNESNIDDPVVCDVDCFGDNSDLIKSSTDEGGSNIEYQVPQIDDDFGNSSTVDTVNSTSNEDDRIFDAPETDKVYDAEKNIQHWSDSVNPVSSASIISSSVVIGSQGESVDVKSKDQSSCPVSILELSDCPNQPILKEYDRKHFPGETASRDFNPSLFKKFPWASFDQAEKKIVCFACYQFGNDKTFSFKNWRKPEKLTKHAKSENHLSAMAKWIGLRINKNKKTSVLAQLESAHKDLVNKNRAYMKVIIESILYTAQQNLPQRGHTEERSNISMQSDINRGNLIELLSLRCKDIPWLSERLNSQLETHRQWISPVVQNEIIDIIASLVIKDISKAVEEADRFSIIVDETTDISTTEQVSVCLRFVDEGRIRETFIGFHDVKSTTGEALFELICEVLDSNGFQIKSLVGQCYDGASNMSGKVKGVAARVREVAVRALYVHCYGHRLNLALQDTLQDNVCVRNALGIIQTLHNFSILPRGKVFFVML